MQAEQYGPAKPGAHVLGSSTEKSAADKPPAHVRLPPGHTCASAARRLGRHEPGSTFTFTGSAPAAQSRPGGQGRQAPASPKKPGSQKQASIEEPPNAEVELKGHFWQRSAAPPSE